MALNIEQKQKRKPKPNFEIGLIFRIIEIRRNTLDERMKMGIWIRKKKKKLKQFIIINSMLRPFRFDLS